MNLDAIRNRLKPHMPDVIADLRAKAHDHVADAPPREAGYSIKNAAGDEAVVRIYDEIWMLGVNAQDFVADLDDISAPKMRVEINSPGGDVWDGIAIYNALRMHPAEVTTRVDGIAASIASVIAQAGDKRVMLGGSQMMIHNAWGLTVGNHADHEEMAGVLAHQDGLIAGIYATASGEDPERFRALMNAETWLTADEAVEAGLADEVLDPSPNDKPKDQGGALADRMLSLSAQVRDVLSDVERLVADHGEAGADLTGRKHAGLVALRAECGRADGLLTPDSDDHQTPGMHPELAEMANAIRKRENEYRASLPAEFLA